jgi:hypothetical protein
MHYAVIADHEHGARRRVLRSSSCAGVMLASAAIAVMWPSSVRAASAGNGEVWWQQCVDMRDDRARLACYDASVPKPTPANAETAAGPPPPPTDKPNESGASITATTKPSRGPMTIRLSIGYGYGIADYAGRLHAIDHGFFNISSGIGSAGGLYVGDVWLDGLLGPDWTVGVEYAQFRNTTHVQLELPQGFSVLTDPIEGNADAELFARMIFLNLAYRPKTIGPLRPSVGAGIAAGRGEVGASLAIQNAFIGTIGTNPHTSFPLGALQGFAGIEYDVTDHVYVALVPRVIWVTGHPVDRDERYIDLIIGSALGVDF